MSRSDKQINKQLALEIRKYLLTGMLLKDIRKELDINENTWDYWYWDDTEVDGLNQGFRTFVKSCKAERMMKKVEQNLDEFLYMDDETEGGKKDPALAKIKQKTTEFVAETLGRLEYSKRSETDVTTNGKEIHPVLVEIINEPNKNNTNT